MTCPLRRGVGNTGVTSFVLTLSRPHGAAFVARRPFSTSTTSQTTQIMFSTAVCVRAAVCGVSRTLSKPSNAKSAGGGSGSNTSMAAPARLAADRGRGTRNCFASCQHRGRKLDARLFPAAISGMAAHRSRHDAKNPRKSFRRPAAYALSFFRCPFGCGASGNLCSARLSAPLRGPCGAFRNSPSHPRRKRLLR